MRERIKEKVELIEKLIKRMDSKKSVPLIEVLKEEIIKLKKLNEDYKSLLNTKNVVYTDKW
jgi:hypothetical protein